MDPCVECPYCGINLLDWPGYDHDLAYCQQTIEARKVDQLKELNKIWNFERPEGKE